MTSEYFYPGTKYSLEPGYGEFSGYGAAALSMTTDPRTANQIQEVSNKLNTGAENFEVSAISPEIFDSIPKQHLEEINRLAKLTGTSPSVHGPLVEASGYTQQGTWAEQDRESAERQMEMAIERSQKISPEGGMPVTFHSTAVLPETEEKVIIEEEGKKKEVIKSALIVDPETGKIGQLRERERFFPGEEGKKFDVKKELAEQNEEVWRNMLTHLAFNTTRGIEYARDAWPVLKEYWGDLKTGKVKVEQLPPEVQRQVNEFNIADIFLRDGYRELKELFNKAYQNADVEDKKKLDAYKTEIADKIPKIKDDPRILVDVVQKGLRVLDDVSTHKIPELYKPLNEFLFDKSSDTFANVAFKAYDKFGNKAPIVSIENPPAGGGMSRAEDLRKLIEQSREKFVEKAVKEGYSKSDAEKAAKQMIGATWDIGHINMLRKYGYEKEDILKQTEKIAPFVKHVHLSDNFGFEHTELPMGMGNVPFQEILKKLGKEGFEGKKVIEAGHWFQHFKTPPFKETLEAMGSPLYPMLAQPSWTQVSDTQGAYSVGYGLMLPEQHFSMYGSGWATLPTELGGQIPGKQSRLSGTPMA